MNVGIGDRIAPLKSEGFRQSELDAYSKVSGDNNPIHLDVELAKQLDLQGTPVQGMLLMAQVSNYLESWSHCHKIRKLHTKFVAPLFAEQPFVIAAKVVLVSSARGTAVLRITVFDDEIMICLGEAEVVIEP